MGLSLVVVLLSYLFRREQQCLGLVSLRHLSEFLPSRSSGSCLWPLGKWQSLFSPRQRESLSPSSAFLSQVLSSFPSPARMLNIISSKIWGFEHKRKNVVLLTVYPLGTANTLGWGKRKAQTRKWHPTPVLLPGKSHGQRSLVGYSPRGHRESDTTERLHFAHFILSHWRRKWQPTPVFLPGESHGQRSLEGHGPWGQGELDTTEVTKHARTHLPDRRKVHGKCKLIITINHPATPSNTLFSSRLEFKILSQTSKASIIWILPAFLVFIFLSQALQNRIRWLDGTPRSMDMNLIKLQKTVKDREAWHAAVSGVAKPLIQLSDWTAMTMVSQGTVVFHGCVPASLCGPISPGNTTSLTCKDATQWLSLWGDFSWLPQIGIVTLFCRSHYSLWYFSSLLI